MKNLTKNKQKLLDKSNLHFSFQVLNQKKIGFMPYKTIKDIENALNGKTSVLRVDLNVPIKDGKITDSKRLIETLPTIKLLLSCNSKKIILLSHFGRPKNQEQDLSLCNIVNEYQNILGEQIFFAKTFDEAKNSNNKIILCENLRFFKEEESGDQHFAKTLSELGDFYINDAFSCSHRAHASISVIGKFKQVYAGLLMLKEIETITSIISGNKKVFGIVGGAKVSTKIDLLKSLSLKMKTIAITGGMANTFLHAKGKNIGLSLCEKDLAGVAREILDLASFSECKILLPQDVVVAKKFEANVQTKVKSSDSVLDDEIILDSGPDFVLSMIKELSHHDILTWNGPLGAFETNPFGISTFFFARAVSSSKITSIIGGGDTAASILHCGLENEMSYISTGGGAFLEWLEGKLLPGIEICKK